MLLYSKYVKRDVKHVKIVHVYGRSMFFITSGFFSAKCHSCVLNSLKKFCPNLIINFNRNAFDTFADVIFIGRGIPSELCICFMSTLVFSTLPVFFGAQRSLIHLQPLSHSCHCMPTFPASCL